MWTKYTPGRSRKSHYKSIVVLYQMNSKADHVSSLSATPTPKPVRAWLEDLHLNEVYTSEVERKALQVDCGVVSGNSNPDINSGLSATPGPKTVRAWLKDVNLYKVITLLYFPFSNLISWRN